jgi:hypothetical protein
MHEKDFTTLPYAPWLEKALQELLNFPVKGLCMYAITENGDVYSNYYEISMKDKLTIAGYIHQDAMYDSLAANGVIQYDDDEEEEGELTR